MTVLPVFAQQSGYYDERAIEHLYGYQEGPLEQVPYPGFRYDILRGETDREARNHFLDRLGPDRATLLRLLHRDQLGTIGIGDSIVVPETFFADIRAYSPFPRFYPGARSIDKLFIVHKSFQLFAAYEFGRLVRWGVTSTGTIRLSTTPEGRYNFNWQQRYRISSESPPGQPWRLNWVFNFEVSRGIHTHQYPVPLYGTASHGCVRLTEADARWVYDWADPWVRSGSKIIHPGTMVTVLGSEPTGPAPPLVSRSAIPVLTEIELPTSPFEIHPGTDQQVRFDRRKARQLRTPAVR